MRQVTRFRTEILSHSNRTMIITDFDDGTATRWCLSEFERERIEAAANPLQVVQEIEAGRWWNRHCDTP